ncbi:phosphoglucomutase [Olsenella uli]|uniref:phosphoglucomutase n=1 Tax=Olsenella uli TaxID=133926 RepID=UPI0028CFF261|nr:phosphoglucomutase [Olsenella uli]
MRIIHFGANGWYARFDEGFDETGVTRVAAAVGLLWGGTFPDGVVYVSYDVRPRSERLASLAAAVLASYGLRTRVSSSAAPLPALEWAVAADKEAIGGVVISGSDLSCDYGGFLLRGPDGGPVSADFALQVDRHISGRADERMGTAESVDLVSPYVSALMQEVDRSAIGACPLRVIVDPLCGSSRGLLADLLRSCGCAVAEIHDGRPDALGDLLSRPVGPWVGDCGRAVAEQGADMGIAVDGDGCRIALIDELGHLVASHDLVALILEHLSVARGLRGRVVATTATSVRVARQAERLGCPLTIVPVGFQRVYEEMRERDVLLACEEYGGMCVPQHLMERDGILAALLAVEMLSTGAAGLTGAPPAPKLSEMVRRLGQSLGHMDYARRDVRVDVATMQSFRNVLPGLNPETVAGRRPCCVSHADGLRLGFDDGAWVMLRPSRTQTLVRIYAEAATTAERDQLLSAACAIVRARGLEI